MKSLKLTASRHRFYFLVLFCCMAAAKNLKAQVVIDWNNSHIGSYIDFIGWDNSDLSATIINGNQFQITKKANHEDIIIHYISFDKKEWTARLDGDKFIHTPNGPWGAVHPDIRLDYIQNDNAECSATISGDDFIITNHNTGQTYQSHYLYYITWNSSHWTAALAKPKFQHWEGIPDTLATVVSYLKYLTWNSSKWTATILPDGSFKHTDQNGKSHIDRNIIYLNYDRSIWGAMLTSGIFKHAPGFIPHDKSAWEKFIGTFTGEPHGGWDTKPPTGTATGEFRGILVKEENGVLYYRPLDYLGVCTDDLYWVPSAKIKSRSKVGKCLNLGQQRDIYSFIYYK